MIDLWTCSGGAFARLASSTLGSRGNPFLRTPEKFAGQRPAKSRRGADESTQIEDALYMQNHECLYIYTVNIYIYSCFVLSQKQNRTTRCENRG